MCVCVCLSIQGFPSLKYAVSKLGDWYAVDIMKVWIEACCSRSSYAFMDLCEVIYTFEH